MLFYERSIQVSCTFQKTRVVNCLLLSYKSFMYSLDTRRFSHVCFGNIFPQSLACPFVCSFFFSRAEV